jgi:hypothetical protein
MQQLRARTWRAAVALASLAAAAAALSAGHKWM